jgi:hypothetical protein
MALRALLEKLPVEYLLKNLPTFHGALTLITASTKAIH